LPGSVATTVATIIRLPRDRRRATFGNVKSECIRPGTPLSLEDAKRLIQQYVDRYNNVRLHSAISYVTPNDMLAGRQAKIHAERDRKLEAARLLR
jgi:putative transposase